MKLAIAIGAALGCVLLLAPPAASAQTGAQVTSSAKQSASVKRRPRVVVKHWHGYGFLPGYRQPILNDTRPEKVYHYWRGYTWDGYPVGSWGTGGYGGMWYRGRFSNGFGPCWTRTPIGPIWNCG